MILTILEIYAAGCVLLMMLLMAVNRQWIGTILSMEVVFLAILWPVVFLAVLLWLGAYWIFGYLNRRNRTQEEL